MTESFVGEFARYRRLGEKPWRRRDSEFVGQDRSRSELERIWAGGRTVLETTLAEHPPLPVRRV